jgi:RNA polymerase sigma factor (sigma-70 family)
MVELKPDRELLREYVEDGSEPAFQTLVERHLDLVFATALRGLNQAEAAREITQNVFIALARKAPWLRSDFSVAGWLHRTTLLEVRRWWRGELRRQRREQTAIELGTTMKDEESLLNALAGELDEGLLGLRDDERQALILRYFEGRTHREIGTLLGASQDAVRMRIDKALGRLTQFFRRRGYAVPAVASTVAAFTAAAKAAPAGLALAATRSALAVGTGGSMTGLKLLLSRLVGLTRPQTAALCAALAAVPVGLEWNVGRVASGRAARAQTELDTARDQQDQVSSELERLSAESARLDAALVEASDNQARQAAARLKIDVLKARLHGMLNDPDYRWPDDLQYVRVPKAVVKSLDLLHKPPMAFSPSGKLADPAIEMLGITAQEKGPTEAALANYWRGVEDLMAASAYETNSPPAESKRLTKTVIIPPLGQPLKDLAQATRAELTQVLGDDREQLLFGDWEQGGIQLFSPGNLWKIAEEPQTVTAWVEPSQIAGQPPRFGVSHSSTMGGISAEGSHSLDFIPAKLGPQFFNTWLQQFGIARESGDYFIPGREPYTDE